MKLLHCKECKDVFRIFSEEETSCKCGKVKGQYEEDGLHAWYSGEPAVPLGFANSSFRLALERQPERGWGEEFEAFVIEKECSTFIKKDEQET